ncbi:UBA/THIF-type NAD/FAD binding fold protein [Sulfitobacter noctilucicola]|uniref:Molybdopterin-synthase adenylyltransferase n=1 Tax=Sulfitobacter noctilucicola TaxID=1342301 RepID=A0A7W6MBL5_9RHOB|nr:HesA/MoeB/ThiF family protein [Sulfitobacter noctilucicola]KIN63263.1 UBA/THIF-type NAD/FAD binding fold protein [Sulfitobacter noctilucicola]MBB4175217.1 molybdopterin/thiamine biosynthesis adenylyltransferase [Sulfitobacter noctilucicola]
MLLVLLLVAAIWFGGGWLGIPREVRATLLALLFVAVLGIQVAFPETHPLRLATGGSAAPWLILGGFGVLVAGYLQVLKRLRSRAVDPVANANPDAKAEAFSETELNRYARHIVLREVGGAGQKALKNAKVLVIGAGGLGSPVLQYLAAAGVGTIGVIDDDTVENANLQRQVIHKDADIGTPKVFSAQAHMETQNPFVTVKPYHRRLTDDIATELVAEYDLVLDGTDNFATRYLVNAACVSASVPLISGALSQWEGQMSVFDPAKGAPCYRCIFPEAPADHLAPSCAEAGVVGPLPGVVGAMMAVEAVKVITGAGTAARGQMLIYDALFGENRSIQIARRADCETCGTV